MKKEELVALGISEELAEKVVEMHNNEINGAFIPKHRLYHNVTQMSTTIFV